MANVIVSSRADDDLDAIAGFIALDGVKRASRVVSRIERSYRKLAVFPYRGRLRPDFGPGIRALAVPPYIIVLYGMTEHGDVLVGRIVDGRRDMRMPLFF